MSMETGSPHICPLCGSSNDCAMSSGEKNGSHCWCREISVAPALLEQVRELTGGTSCICRKCATALAGIEDAPLTIARLYGTASCHLCEEAERIILSAGAFAVQVDIAGDAALLERYGERIPVLQRIDNGAELDWPFDDRMAAGFLA